MGVLSRSEVLNRLRKGDLAIFPLLGGGTQVGTASVDLRMGTTAATVRGSEISHVDPKEYEHDREIGGSAAEQGRRRKLERMSVPFGQALLLHAGSLILTNTVEFVSLPDDLSGVVTARSSWAREGLSIATATFINPGFAGTITLELANLGQVPIAIYPGMRVAQIALHSLEGAPARQGEVEAGQFQFTLEPGAGDITKDDLRFIPHGEPFAPT